MSNEELQKAIDDITKESNDGAIAAAVPTSEMPVAAMPEGMMPADAAAAMPASDAVVASAADPIAPPAPAPEIPEMPAPVEAPVVEPVAPEAPAPVAETPVAPVEAPVEAAPAPAPDLGEGVTIGADGLIDVAAAQEVAEKISNVPTEEPAANLIKVKQDTLRELFPLMDKLNIDPVQKFGIYKDIIAITKEQSAVEQAHEVVSQIADEQTRADALLELLEIIAGFKA